jgi:hypothetical protein
LSRGKFRAGPRWPKSAANFFAAISRRNYPQDVAAAASSFLSDKHEHHKPQTSLTTIF